MDSKTNQKITWTLLELTGLLEEEDAHVRFERTTKHLALHPYHLVNIQRGLNQILKSSLNSYDRELNGFVLAFKNPKLLSNFGELLYDSPFIHIDIEADFYLFRPMVGSFLKGIVNKKGLDHIVVLVHKIYTISIPKPDSMEEWLGDSVEIGQEIRCCVNQVNNKSKPPFICATLNSDYLQGCRLSESINNMEDVTESHNLNGTIKIEKTNDEISEDNAISDKERKKHRKKHKKSHEIDTFKNIKYEDNNTDSTIERHNVNSIVKVDNSINEEDDTISDKEKKKHRKKHKKSREIASESFFKDQTEAESSNNTGNDIYRNIKCESNANDNKDSIIESQNLNSTIKIDSSNNQVLENDAISEKEERKYRKKHKKSHESDLESTFEDKNKITLNNTETDIYIKCEDNINNTNSAIESCNLNSSTIKIDSSINRILEDDAVSDKEKKKYRKKHRKSREIDIESTSEDKNDIKLNNNTGSNIHRNIKCEDNIHNTNSAIENHNLDRVIKIENLTSKISEDVTSDRERNKHRKKRKKSLETDTENEAASDYLEGCKKRKKSILSDSESKTHITIKTEKFDSDLEFKSPVKIKVEKV
ncbi:dna-directed rna polymerase i subunit rpa43 [Lasius niger]|uniref:Dna-directed rna polymerase i subunit rpa43 n=1 Tax=Lasius niger TaxID=67767 RepID=A0A0J7NBY6_LASNI|nr:dna-directed rna polymerase i subunit rpa43 [Lasius niger]